jgi:hypothetical protein
MVLFIPWNLTFLSCDDVMLTLVVRKVVFADNTIWSTEGGQLGTWHPKSLLMAFSVTKQFKKAPAAQVAAL